jgi:hypothetical protein
VYRARGFRDGPPRVQGADGHRSSQRHREYIFHFSCPPGLGPALGSCPGPGLGPGPGPRGPGPGPRGVLCDPIGGCGEYTQKSCNEDQLKQKYLVMPAMCRVHLCAAQFTPPGTPPAISAAASGFCLVQSVQPVSKKFVASFPCLITRTDQRALWHLRHNKDRGNEQTQAHLCLLQSKPLEAAAAHVCKGEEGMGEQRCRY